MARLLIVDDSATARGILARLLEGAHDCSFAAGGREAVEAVAESDYDLVLLDLLMPDMDGFAALAEIRFVRPALPVIVVSADIQDSTRIRAEAAGAAALVRKPPRKDELAAAVGAALAAGRP